MAPQIIKSFKFILKNNVQTSINIVKGTREPEDIMGKL